MYLDIEPVFILRLVLWHCLHLHTVQKVGNLFTFKPWTLLQYPPWSLAIFHIPTSLFCAQTSLFFKWLLFFSHMNLIRTWYPHISFLFSSSPHNLIIFCSSSCFNRFNHLLRYIWFTSSLMRMVLVCGLAPLVDSFCTQITGSVLNAARRMQINVRIKNNPEFT